jgi:DNA polymerase-3 subunit alpha
MPKFITRELVDFLVDNIAKYPGASELFLQLIDRDDQMTVKLHTFNKHIEMNDELAHFLSKQPDIDVYIDTINK